MIFYLKRERLLAEGDGFFFLTLPAPDWSVISPVLCVFPKIPELRPGTRPTGFACKDTGKKAIHLKVNRYDYVMTSAVKNVINADNFIICAILLVIGVKFLVIEDYLSKQVSE